MSLHDRFEKITGLSFIFVLMGVLMSTAAAPVSNVCDKTMREAVNAYCVRAPWLGPHKALWSNIDAEDIVLTLRVSLLYFFPSISTYKCVELTNEVILSVWQHL